jgi:endonuclease YncB( thermonuclease family)
MMKTLFGELRKYYISIFAAAIVFGAFGSSAFGKSIEGVVTYVSDGDTLWVRTAEHRKLKVRLYGIDAPEVRHRDKPGQPFGREAATALRSKVRGEHVSVEVRDIDQYGRLVGIVRFEGRDINLEMVNEGWAWAYRAYLERPYASEYIEAEKKARADRLGLWKEANPQPPWEFRRSVRDKIR